MSEESVENKLENDKTETPPLTVSQDDTTEDQLNISQDSNDSLNLNIVEAPDSPNVTNPTQTSPNLKIAEPPISPKETKPIQPNSNLKIIEALDSSDDVSSPSEPTPKQTKKSRELKSLLEAVKEANLDTNIPHKRKSDQHPLLTPIKTPKRRNSSSSNDSFQSTGKRSTRSQNPEFVQKHKTFLKAVTASNSINDDGDDNTENVYENSENDEDWNETKHNSAKKISRRFSRTRTPTPVGNSKTNVMGKTLKRKGDSLDESVEECKVDDSKKIKKSASPVLSNLKKDKDKFCWRCHREGINIQCETCPRSYHIKCLKISNTIPNTEHWPCPECVAIIKAESTKTMSPIFKNMTQEHLCDLLKFAVKRMINFQGSEPFLQPVDSKIFPDYRNYIIQPMDLTTLQKNIRENVYGSTVGFLADSKWILHNSIIFNSHQSKLTTAAKAIIKICKQEMSEIETCAECYLNANTKKNTWFVEVCSKPHILLWAKLKGFPFWPAKAMKHDNNNVHVKFFGAHDRAWVPVKECYLYSKKDPNTTNKQKRSNIAECVKEVDIHIKKLETRFGEFKHAPYRTPYDPAEENKQILMMLPSYDPRKGYLNLTIKSLEDPKSNENSPVINKSKGISRSQSIESDQLSLSSISKSSLNSESDKTKNQIDLNSVDDKFVEGYGTEDEDEKALNFELRSKIAGDYFTDTDEETSSQESSDKKDTSDCEDMLKTLSSNDLSIIYKGKCHTRGGYKNVTGKIKTIPRSTTSEIEIITKRSLENSPEFTLKRRESEESIKSSSGKINKLELGSNVEFSLGVHDTNGEIEAQKPPKQESMADKLIKKINKSMSDISKKCLDLEKPNSEDLDAPKSPTDKTKNIPENKSDTSENDIGLKITDVKSIFTQKESEISGNISDTVEEESNAAEISDTIKNDLDLDSNDPISNQMDTVSESDSDFDEEKPISSLKKSILGQSDSILEPTEPKLVEKDPKRKGSISIGNELILVPKSVSIQKDSNLNQNPILIQKNVKLGDQKDKNLTQKDPNFTQTSPILIKRVPTMTQKDPNLTQKDPILAKENPNLAEKDPILTKNDSSSVKIDPTLTQIDSDLVQEDSDAEAGEANPNFAQNQNLIDKTKNLEQKNILQNPKLNPDLVLIKKVTAMKSLGLTQKVQIQNLEKQNCKDSNFDRKDPNLDSEDQNLIPKDPYLDSKDPNLVQSNPNSEEISNLNENNSKLDQKEKNPVLNIAQHLNTLSQNVLEKNLQNIAQESKSKVASEPTLVENPITKAKVSNLSTSFGKGPILIKKTFSLNEKELEKSDPVPKARKLSETNQILSERTLNLIDKTNSAITDIKKMPTLESKNPNMKKIEDNFADSSSEESNDSNTEVETPKKVPDVPSFIKVVNVSDIMNQKSPSKEKRLSKGSETDYREILHDQLEIKSEPISDSEETQEKGEKREKPQYDVTLSVVPKKTTPEKSSVPFKVIDNLTRVIDEVAKNSMVQKSDSNSNSSPSLTQRARKSFPAVNKPTQVYQVKRFNQEKNLNKLTTVPVKTSIATIPSKNSVTITKTTAVTPKSTTIATTSKEGLIYITSNQNSMILPPNQTISLGANVANPILAMVQHPTLSNTGLLIQNSTPIQISANLTSNPVVTQNETPSTEILSSILTEDASKTAADLISKQPPKLKPKPPGPLSTCFDEGNPSTAGPINKTINSMSHRMADYFCGLLKETMADLGNVGNPEARIKMLELEIEDLKYKHNEEMLEFRKNISTVIKDIQKSVVEERNKVIDETRSKCEEEKRRAVEEAKSKQWCAYCFKEAQFYCCWNTSYCDYPCQQKHWATHMKTCSQSSVRTTTASSNGTTTTTNKPQAPTTIFKAVQKQFPPGTKIVKTSRMIQVKPGQAMPAQKSPVFIQRPVQLQPTTIGGQSTLTLLESTPGNFEIVGSHEPISLNGKLIPTTIGKVKTTTPTSTTTSNVSTQPKTYIIAQKPVTVAKPVENSNNANVNNASTENK